MSAKLNREYYDVTREMRRLFLAGRLGREFREHADSFEKALLGSGRIVFAYDDETYHTEMTVYVKR